MNINLKFLLLGTSLSLIPQYAAGQCAVTDCQQLGYTSLKKCDGGLKCPFGEYWACPKVEEKAVLGECTGYAKNCKIGDILNNDGTCSTDNIAGKLPLGVVIYIGDDNCGYAMTARALVKNSIWSSVYPEVIVGSGATKNQSEVILNFDACDNTQKIIQAGSFYNYPAAWVAVDYEPDAAPSTKGKWCLPAPGMLNSLYVNLSIIDAGIAKIGGVRLSDTEEYILSSVEYNENNIWVFCKGCNGGISYYSKYPVNGYSVVRPVIKF